MCIVELQQVIGFSRLLKSVDHFIDNRHKMTRELWKWFKTKMSSVNFIQSESEKSRKYSENFDFIC